jgi:hypothetical protein
MSETSGQQLDRSRYVGSRCEIQVLPTFAESVDEAPYRRGVEKRHRSVKHGLQKVCKELHSHDKHARETHQSVPTHVLHLLTLRDAVRPKLSITRLLNAPPNATHKPIPAYMPRKCDWLSAVPWLDQYVKNQLDSTRKASLEP